MMVATVGINVILALGVWILLGLLMLKIQANIFGKAITKLEKALSDSFDSNAEAYEIYQKIIKGYKRHVSDLNDKIKQLEGEQNGK
ncbi:hypothetical protein [Brochothrix thermosphacta]|uniref:hypothetical protein n=1 Tax=Brochothrix thermosphacta TaxID=2756 RepID=UPI003F9470D3